MDQEERSGERLVDQSEKSIVDWRNKSRLEQASRNNEIRVERRKQMLKDGNWSFTRKRVWGKGKWHASIETAPPGFLRAQIRDPG